jgi:hypothetical protein
MKTVNVNLPIPVIGLMGKAGAGKSTAARYLAKSGYVHMGFSGTIRRMVKTLGLTEEELNGSLKESPCRRLEGHSPREVMQVIGSALRAMDADFWCNIWKRRAQLVLLDCPGVLNDSVRYANEAAMIRSMGGAVIEIRSSNAIEDAGIYGHESERMDFEPDVIALNDGVDLCAFHDSIDDAIAVLLEPAFDDLRLAA